MRTSPTSNDIAHRLNWLRAGVLGANDGIVSVAAIVVGVAGVTTDSGPILVAGAAGVVGGAISMALGEYVSVSSQKDSQKALIEKERRELAEQPEEELEELAAIYQGKGLSADTARTVARELTAHDALGAHLSAELQHRRDGHCQPVARRVRLRRRRSSSARSCPCWPSCCRRRTSAFR